MKQFFSDFFDVPEKTIEGYGAFNVSLVSDLPLFIDPFLLFNSKKPAYRKLHDSIIKYLEFLLEKTLEDEIRMDWFEIGSRFPKSNRIGLGTLKRVIRDTAWEWSSQRP